jgi:hypothetical protein
VPVPNPTALIDHVTDAPSFTDEVLGVIVNTDTSFTVPDGVDATIVPEVEGKLNTFKIGNKTYIPLSVIPKVHSAYFKPT